MIIAVVAGGTRGDVQPYLALAKGLKSAGHTLKFATSDDFESACLHHALEFHSTGESVERLLQGEEWRRAIETGGFLRIQAKMRSAMKRIAHAAASVLPDILKGSDLVIAGVGGLAGAFSVAEKLKIPIVQAFLFPITPTRHFASPVTPGWAALGSLNRLTFPLLQQALWQSVRVMDDEVRRSLEMSPLPFMGPFRDLERRKILTLYGFSEQVIPRPDDWLPHHIVTGYWFLDAESAWSPPEDLKTFLRNGKPPVYLGFGSMGSRDPEKTAALVIRALEISGRRGILAAGWGGLVQRDLPETVFALTSAPHDWLFPQMAAVVHHGGAGTTAAGLRAGKPTVVIPFFGDQPFWGRKIAELGVGPTPVPRKRLTAVLLAEAIRQATGEAQFNERAHAIGERIRAERGVECAVEWIQRAVEIKSGA